MMIVRNKAGRFQKVPEPKFFDGEFVTTSDKHYSTKKITQVIKPTWIDRRGWVYGEQFWVIRNGEIDGPGGTGWSPAEDHFEKLTDPILKLMVEKRYRINEKLKCEQRIKVLDEELRHIRFALSKLNGGKD